MMDPEKMAVTYGTVWIPLEIGESPKTILDNHVSDKTIISEKMQQ